MSTTNSKKQYESKLPKKIRESLGKEMKAIFKGVSESKNIKIDFNELVTITYSCKEGRKASCLFENLDYYDLGVKCISIIKKNLKKDVKVKLQEMNCRIEKLHKNMKDLCATYNANINSEFDFIFYEQKLQVIE